MIDNGIGLPKENRARLLEPYVTTREKGTGLGLAIVGRILEEHGGRIELRDASEKIPGARGAWMQLRFIAEPLAAEHGNRTAQPRNDRQGGNSRAELTKKTWQTRWRRQGDKTMASDILIVDDEADIRELVAGILQDEGHGTRTARDSDEALGAVVARRPNLVFLDIWLQGSRLDGLQLLDSLKADHPELPIVMISGHGNIETAVSAIKRGAYDFIEKPFKADRLLLVAERALENSRLQARGARTQAARTDRRDAGRPFAGRQSIAADHRKGGADQQPHPDRRALRQRQGTRRAHHSRSFGARQRAVRGDQCRRHHAGAYGSRIVRRRRRQRHHEPQSRRARRGAWRHAVHRRNRRHAARDAKQDFARPGRSDIPARRRQHQGHRRRAHRVLDQPQYRVRHRRREIPRRSLSPAVGGADPGAGARRAARGYSGTGRIFHDADFADHRACRSARSAPTRLPCCNRTIGRAMCGSCATTSSG